MKSTTELADLVFATEFLKAHGYTQVSCPFCKGTGFVEGFSCCDPSETTDSTPLKWTCGECEDGLVWKAPSTK